MKGKALNSDVRFLFNQPLNKFPLVLVCTIRCLVVGVRVTLDLIRKFVGISRLASNTWARNSELSRAKGRS